MKYLLLFSLILTSACSSPCKGTIGVTYKPWYNTIEVIEEGSPAEKIGLKINDELLYPWDLVKKPGDKVEVRVIRNETELLTFKDVELACITKRSKVYPTLKDLGIEE